MLVYINTLINTHNDHNPQILMWNIMTTLHNMTVVTAQQANMTLIVKRCSSLCGPIRNTHSNWFQQNWISCEPIRAALDILDHRWEMSHFSKFGGNPKSNVRTDRKMISDSKLNVSGRWGRRAAANKTMKCHVANRQMKTCVKCWK